MKNTLVILSLFMMGIAVEAAPRRVIALSPALTELIFALKLDDKLVGVSQFSDFPQAAQKITQVGPYTKPSLEKIVSLKPDLVILPLEGPNDAKIRFDQLKIPYVVVSMRNLLDIGVAAEKVADLLGASEQGKKFKAEWNEKLNSKNFKTNFHHKKPKVMIEVENSSLIVAGSHTFLNEMVEKCGGENIFADHEGYPHVSRELMISRKVDVILLADHFSSEKEREQAIASWKRFPTTSKARIIKLPPDIATRPGPRLIEGIGFICETL